MMRSKLNLMLTFLTIAFLVTPCFGGDWARFRGPNGSGVNDQAKVPVTWSESENLSWKTELPGPGTSSPIVVGDRVYVTSYSGYGLDRSDPGDIENLQRHLVCIHRNNGRIVWDKPVAAVLPEDPYEGNFTEHGYASHTPVSDGEAVYVFFGKSGVLAFDLDGNQLWQTSVGTESGRQRWGSASSPILYKHLVIVNASDENEALVALNKKTGKEVWKAQAAGLSGSWSTPVLVDLPDGRQEVVVAVPKEVWGFNPDTGKLLWYAETAGDSPTCTSLTVNGDMIFRLGGRDGEVTALRAGGKNDVTDTHIVWTSRQQARINTPVYHDGHLYWINQGVALCIDAKSGERVYQQRLSSSQASAAEGAQRAGEQERGEQRREGRRRGRGGGGRGQSYSSPVIANDALFFVARSGETFVLEAKPKFRQLASNRFESDSSEYSATPAISDGQLFIRSSNVLYCIAE